MVLLLLFINNRIMVLVLNGSICFIPTLVSAVYHYDLLLIHLKRQSSLRLDKMKILLLNWYHLNLKIQILK
jgi:hypothetical protein